MTPVLYGIANCDTVRKARKWLEERDVHYQFYDVRETPVTREHIAKWLQEVGVDGLINRRSTTWRNLSDEDKARIAAGDVIDIVQTSPTLIKRPVLEYGNTVKTGFNAHDYAALLQSA
jgi:arsenate reductase